MTALVRSLNSPAHCRAPSLYSNWQISTNDSATLKTLASTNFDPQQTVLVSTPLPAAPAVNATNENSGTVEFKSYAPKDIVFDAKASTPDGAAAQRQI